MELIMLASVLASIALTSVDKVEGNCRNKSPSEDCLFTKDLPTKHGHCYLTNCRHGNFLASVANGYLGTVIFSDTIHVSGVYNGKAYVKKGHGWPVDYNQHTRRARVPATNPVDFDVQLEGNHSYALDTKDGVFYHWFSGSNTDVEQRTYAHRVYRNLLVTEVTILKRSSKEVPIIFYKNFGNESKDLDLKEVKVSKEYPFHQSQKVLRGQTHEAESDDGPRVELSIVYSQVPDQLLVPAETKEATYSYLTSIVSSLETNDTLALALKTWKIGNQSQRTLFKTHKARWNEIWKSGNIIIGGNPSLAQSVSASLYNILSSTRQGWPYGLSPGGLPGGEEYLGHVFWDQDIWMYPVLTALYTELAKESLNYRYIRLDAARGIATKFGFHGAMFPWESALTGIEVSPGEVYGRNQIHVTSDIAYAVRQYWRCTGDLAWIKDRGFELVYDTAKFWASRVSFDTIKQAYVINDVMPPDEHTYPANNSVYTNVGAKLNLDFAIKLGRVLGRHIPEKWEEIRDEILIPFNEEEQYHPEHDSFNKSDIVKQADTILIGYPLMYDMPKKVRENDLNLYGQITNLNGPAMTHSMFTIGWLEIGNFDKATNAFVKNYDNIHGPFKVWSEIRFGKGATNFITGAGGFLQSLIYGYGGIRFKEDGLYFKGILPENCTFLYLHGIKFHGNHLSFNVTKESVKVTLEEATSKAKKLVLYSGDDIIPFGLKRSKSLTDMEGVFRTPEQTSKAPKYHTPLCSIFLSAFYAYVIAKY